MPRLLALAFALLAVGRPVWADEGDDEKSTYRIALDRVEHEPSSLGGTRLRVYVDALSLLGSVLDLTEPKSFKLLAGSEVKAPFAIGRFAQTDTPLAMVIVVQANGPYAEVLPVIADALDSQVFAALDEKTTQLAVLPYGDTLATAKLAPIKTARAKIAQVQSDGSQSEPALLDTLERALSLLKKAKADPEGLGMRKMIVLIGDGHDLSGDRDRVTRLGERAAKEGVRIHSFGYAPNDIRRPLLLLGELSKRSFGTFRWIRSGKAESWTPAAQQLRDQINQQYVLTYFLGPDDDLAGKKIKLTTAGRVVTTSLDELKVPEPTCAGQTCPAGAYCTGTVCAIPKQGGGRGILGWLLIVGGVLLAALLVLGSVGYVMTKRQQQMQTMMEASGMQMPPAAAPRSPPPQVASVPPASVPPASVPPPVAAPQPAVVSGPRLYIMSGPRQGEQIALRHGFLIGKQLGCDLVIDDGYTSSQHAQIGMDHFGNCRLYDRGSTNGTFVNGQRISEYALEHGMTLRIGSTELRFLAQ